MYILLYVVALTITSDKHMLETNRPKIKVNYDSKEI